MAYSPTEQERVKQIGANGGTVNTNGMPAQQKQATDKLVNDGKNGR